MWVYSNLEYFESANGYGVMMVVETEEFSSNSIKKSSSMLRLRSALHSMAPNVRVLNGLLLWFIQLMMKYFCFLCRSMSGTHLLRMGHSRSSSKGSLKDFTIATPEEYVKRFGGDFVIKRVGASVIRSLRHSQHSENFSFFSGAYCQQWNRCC